MTAFSQPGTDSGKVCFSTPVAKAIAIDLVRGDSATAELQATQALVIKYQEKVGLQDSVIAAQSHKETNYLLQIGAYQQKDQINDQMVTILTTENKKLRTQLKVGVVSFGAILLAAVIFN